MITGILAAIAGLGTIVGGVVYLVRTGIWTFSKTTEEKIDADAADRQKQQDDSDKTGRPTWN